MARMPGALWRPITTNYTKGGQASVRGVVVHIMAGTLEGTDAWFRNPQARASSHFGTGKDGELRQWVDTADRAWAQAAGNSSWISVENEGKGGDVLTDGQLDANAKVLAWAHVTEDVPLRVATSPTDRGLGYHAMGGSAWGGHTQCPGTRIVAQLPEIVRRAKNLVEGDDMPSAEEIAAAVWEHRIVNPARPDAKGQPAQTPAYAFQRSEDSHYDSVTRRLTALTAQVGALSSTVGKLAEGGGLDAAEIKAAAEAGAQAALAQLGDALKEG